MKGHVEDALFLLGSWRTGASAPKKISLGSNDSGQQRDALLRCSHMCIQGVASNRMGHNRWISLDSVGLGHLGKVSESDFNNTITSDTDPKPRVRLFVAAPPQNECNMTQSHRAQSHFWCFAGPAATGSTPPPPVAPPHVVPETALQVAVDGGSGLPGGGEG